MTSGFANTRHTAESELPVQIVLLYGVRGAKDAPFPTSKWLAELHKLPVVDVLPHDLDLLVTLRESAQEWKAWGFELLSNYLIEHSSRPLLVCCYGLAGLVLKEALVQAERLYYQYRKLLAAVIGIAFVATPHLTDSGDSGKFSLLSLLQPHIPLARLPKLSKLEHPHLPILVDICDAFAKCLRRDIHVASIRPSPQRILPSKRDRILHRNAQSIEIFKGQYFSLGPTNNYLEQIKTVETLHGAQGLTDASCEVFSEIANLLARSTKHRLDAAKAYPPIHHPETMSRSDNISDLYSDLTNNVGLRRLANSDGFDSTNSGVLGSNLQQPGADVPPLNSLRQESPAAHHGESSPELRLPCRNVERFRDETQHLAAGRQAVVDAIDAAFFSEYPSSSSENATEIDFSTLHAFVLYGGEGMGKTHIARSYAYMRKSKFEVVFWIDASTNANLMAGLRELGSQLGLLLADSAHPDEDPIIRNTISRWLSNPLNNGSMVSWLLILDGANDWHVVSEVWPRDGQGCLLLTTRQPPDLTTLGATSLLLGPLSSKDAAAMLLSITETENDKDAALYARSIARSWDGIPICMELVKSLMKSKHLSLSDFEAIQTKIKKDYFRRNILDDLASSSGIFNALSQQIVNAQDKDELALLLVLSFLNGNEINEQILTNFSMNTTVGSFPSDKRSYTHSRDQLRATSVINYDVENGAIRILKTVQDAALGKFYPAGPEFLNGFLVAAALTLSAWPRNITVDGAFARIETNTRWGICSSLIPHVDHLWERYLDLNIPERRKLASCNFAILLTEAAWYAVETADIITSQQMAERGSLILENIETAGQEQLLDILSALHNTRAAIFSRLNRPKKSLFYAEQFLETQKRLKSIRNPKGLIGAKGSLKLAAAYSEVALARLACNKQGLLEESLLKGIPELLQESENIRRSHQNFKPIDLFNVLRYEALYHLSQKGWVRAEKCFTKAIEDRAKVYGKHDVRGPRCGVAVVGMGDCLFAQKKLLKACDFYRQGYNCLQNAMNEGHLTTLRAQFKLARCLFELETTNLQELRSQLQHCISMYRKQAFVDAELARSIFLSAQVLRKLGLPAQVPYNEALQIRARLLDTEGLQQEDTEPLQLHHFDKLVPFAA